MSAEMILIEGEDYYWEGAMMVFTAGYHLRRGFCCGNGCRHCPYEVNRREREEQVSDEKDEAA